MSAITFTCVVIVIIQIALPNATNYNDLDWMCTLDIKYLIWEALVLCSDCKKFDKHSPRQRIKSKLIVLIW